MPAGQVLPFLAGIIRGLAWARRAAAAREASRDIGLDPLRLTYKHAYSCTAIASSCLNGEAPISSASAAGEAFWGLGELVELAGARLGEKITPRTVRLYATEGLINRPDKDGRRAVYAQRHLLQLLLVRSLARRGLSLSAIAPLVACDDEALQEQLNQLDDGHVSSGPSPESNDALDCLENTESPTAELSPSLLPFLGAPLGSRSPSLRASRLAGLSNLSSTRWHRFQLSPGVELHLSESASIPSNPARREAWLQRLFHRLREQLDS